MKRLYNLVHYIINKQTDEDFKKLGKVKLNKILWFADREYMYNNFTSISHSDYIKLPNGPVPKKIDSILKSLIKNNCIIQKDISINGYIQHSFISIGEPDTSDFTVNEISVLDKYIYEITNNHTANSISDISHDKSWELANIGHIIPIETVFSVDISDHITEEEIKEAGAIFAS